MFLPDYRPDPPDADEFIPRCPVCGRECDTLCLDSNREVFGCDLCVTLIDAYEYLAPEEYC